MTLPGFLIKELRLALQDAFPREEEFKRLVRESDLNKNIEEETIGKNLKEIVSGIIDWAETNNKLTILIEAAYEENSGNEKLKAFVQKMPLVMHWMNIKPILEDIINTKGISIIKYACRNTLANIPRYKHDINGNFNELINLDVDGLEKIFLQKCVYNDIKVPTLVEFAERLTKDEDVQKPYNEQLNKWIEVVVKELKISQPTYSSTPPSTNDSQTTLQSYLLIVVESQGKNKVSLKAELIPNYHYYHSDQKPCERVPINLEAEKPVVNCSFTKIADKIYSFIRESREHLSDDNYNLTIEVFLPYKYLNESIESQEVNIGNQIRIIGFENRYVARSFERFNTKKEEYVSKLKQKWKTLESFLNNSSTADVNKKFSHIQKFDNCNFFQLSVELQNKKEEILGLIVTCCLPESEQNKNNFFHHIFNAGIPICLWTRRNDIENVDTGFDQLLSIEALNDHLVDSVFQLRRNAYAKENKQDYLGYHIGFLCDNPYRLPSCFMPDNSRLIATGF